MAKPWISACFKKCGKYKMNVSSGTSGISYFFFRGGMPGSILRRGSSWMLEVVGES